MITYCRIFYTQQNAVKYNIVYYLRYGHFASTCVTRTESIRWSYVSPIHGRLQKKFCSSWCLFHDVRQKIILGCNCLFYFFKLFRLLLLFCFFYHKYCNPSLGFLPLITYNLTQPAFRKLIMKLMKIITLIKNKGK